MHTSKFCDRQSLCRLIDSFYHATKGAVAMAVRTPAQLRSLETGLSEYTDPGTRRQILSLTGLYNDATPALKPTTALMPPGIPSPVIFPLIMCLGGT